MRLRLHGYPVSNYFNIARAALIEKELPHKIVTTRASQDDVFLARSPMGKIPVLEAGDAWIGETVAILEFLEEACPVSRPLLPSDPVVRARARQVINVVQMYVEAPARSLFPGVFAAGSVPDVVRAQGRTTLDRATAALRRLLAPSPFFHGDRPCADDLFAFYNLDVADRVTGFLFERSIIAEAGLVGWAATMRDLPSSQAVLADFEPLLLQYLKDHDAPYRPSRSRSEQLTHA